MIDLNRFQKNREKKINQCILLLSRIDNDTAKYNIELLKKFKEVYILNGEDTLPDRIIAELNCC